MSNPDERAPVRAIYALRARPEDAAALERAWRAVARAHAPDGALGSVLLSDPDDPGRFVAISRWRSRRAWERGRRDERAPAAYEAFRALARIESRAVLDELGVEPRDR